MSKFGSVESVEIRKTKDLKRYARVEFSCPMSAKEAVDASSRNSTKKTKQAPPKTKPQTTNVFPILPSFSQMSNRIQRQHFQPSNNTKQNFFSYGKVQSQPNNLNQPRNPIGNPMMWRNYHKPQYYMQQVQQYPQFNQRHPQVFQQYYCKQQQQQQRPYQHHQYYGQPVMNYGMPQMESMFQKDIFL